MTSVWRELYKEYSVNSTYSFLSFSDSRESLFKMFFHAIIRGERPYGYYRVLNELARPTTLMNVDFPISEHEMDFVNFLVAVKREIPVDLREAFMYMYMYGRDNHTLSRHNVTSVNGPVPPSKAYHETCRVKQLVPPRYTKFFSEGNSYLPDSTALELIIEKCHYQPEEVIVNVLTFSTFVLNVEQELGSINDLRDYFKYVKSLTIKAKMEHNHRTANYIKFSKYDKCKDIARLALDLILLAPKPKLTSLTIDPMTSPRGDMINSIMPTLIAYGGLRELALQVYGERYPDFQELTLITEHQLVLHTLSISSDVKGTPKFPEKHFISWIHTCYKKPTLQYLKLSIDPISVKFLIQVLTDFISTPCSHSTSLLPKSFRVQLLHKIPIIDICRLEDTEFVTGIDMEANCF